MRPRRLGLTARAFDTSEMACMVFGLSWAKG
jgi:hypothetical protein